jgi:hypothetical protein
MKTLVVALTALALVGCGTAVTVGIDPTTGEVSFGITPPSLTFSTDEETPINTEK